MSRANLKPVNDRFWEKVDKDGLQMPDMPTRCWSWKACINHDGYGGFQFDGKFSTAHRFSYLLHIGNIPKGMEVRHICHNPICCNPDHLKLGTHTENMKDLALSGRRKGLRIKYKRPPKYKPSLEERFWNKVNKNGPTIAHIDTPCWVWMAHCNISGHGRFSVNGKLGLAHRVSWLIHYGEFDNALDVLHKCDNPSCINPDHLFLGTHKDNMVDMVNKGRNVVFAGEASRTAKLTEAQVKEIKNKSTFTTQTQLAKDYGVSQAAIWYILNGRNWKHLE